MLFIRSQDRYSIIETKAVCIEKKSNTYWLLAGNTTFWCGNTNGDGLQPIACYATEERALEVMDQIEEWIENYPDKVFQMPEE